MGNHTAQKVSTLGSKNGSRESCGYWKSIGVDGPQHALKEDSDSVEVAVETEIVAV